MPIKLYTRKEFDHWTTIPTRWGDMDGLRHINHAAYLTYMETARLDYYNHMGYDFERWDQIESTILASMTVDYIGQVTHQEVLEIGQRITRIGKKSFVILTAIFKEGDEKPILQANFVMVAINYETGETVVVPKIFHKYLNRL